MALSALFNKLSAAAFPHNNSQLDSRLPLPSPLPKPYSSNTSILRLPYIKSDSTPLRIRLLYLAKRPGILFFSHTTIESRSYVLQET